MVDIFKSNNQFLTYSCMLLLLLIPEGFNLDTSRRQDFWASRQPYHTALKQAPTCINTPLDNVTVAHAVVGYNGVFHSRGMRCNWTVQPDIGYFNTTDTTLTFYNFQFSDDSTCIICQLVDYEESFYLFYIIVKDVVPLNFTEKTESPPTDLSPCYTLYGQPIIFNGSANFTFSCHFTGYPPVQSVTWDLGHFNDYDCITYSEDNQSVTLGLSESLVEDFSLDTVVTCTATNGIDTICGMRHLYYTFGYLSSLQFYLPLQSQPSGEVEMNSTGSASFNCSTNKLSNEETLRVCRVDYSKAEECLNRQPEKNYTCCSCSYYDPSCPWTVEEGSSTALSSYCTVTTDSRGYYQCEVYDPVINEYQPLGEPLLVVEQKNGNIKTDKFLASLPFFISGYAILSVPLLILLSGTVYLMIKVKRLRTRRNYIVEDVTDQAVSRITGIKRTKSKTSTETDPLLGVQTSTTSNVSGSINE